MADVVVASTGEVGLTCGLADRHADPSGAYHRHGALDTDESTAV
jgi:hypothetical protein